MITKERLLELIKGNKSVRLYRNCGWIIDSLFPKKWKNYYLTDTAVFRDNYGYINYKDLFEDFEDAKWAKEFGNINKTISLSLPTWQELKTDFIDNKRRCGSYPLVEKPDMSLYVQIYSDGYVHIVLFADTQYTWELTKANYTLACRKAKELFLGGE